LVDEAEDFAARVDLSEGGVTVAVSGEVDLATAPLLWASIEPVLGNRPGVLVLDVTDLRFIDSSGLSVIVRAYRAMQGHGGKIVVRMPSAAVRQVLDIAGLDRLVTIED
jgi:anti-sigma B factor antagonist